MLAVYVLGGFCAVILIEGMFWLFEKADQEIRGS